MPAGFRSIGRRLGRAAVMVGGVALLLQLLGWAFLVPVANATTGETVMICTPQGMASITLPDGPPPESLLPDGKPTLSMGEDCPVCGLVAGLTAPPPLLTVVLPVSVVAHSSIGLPGQHIAAGWFLSRLKARAPPALV
ncbi:MULTISPECIES: DUF2946 domain-containing protein [Azospirillum]|uniref:DUF2946 domain-containing protein n=2 Tax=Azospirillum brasilense TaxID=192 RepID=A0ABU4P2C7_AZOBR|nr:MULTISPECIES: DUF2946 domain-containing protein [Azospirillum]ALJ39095.1 hypothetical protein AMK58_26845 [Azospirillum brasilense]MDW7557687.1 DUF2946 domain-containing protein [Azospirillum brasilense]MDW7595749.1 DUF2946 domain-containing protein [Azospirillum brasilense]MDW7630754.1 DUF2946 domain-containing protein [Azospirillum brasilense]MDX5950485.1 DUF2946 domain-containing protein [Azospirillum brasilense]